MNSGWKCLCILLTFVTRIQADDEPSAATVRSVVRGYEQRSEDAVAEFRRTLRALRDDFEAEIATVRSAANDAGDSAEVGRADEALDEDPQIIRVEPRRSLWKSANGFFERLHEGHWIEKIPNGNAKLFSESARTEEYVEISGQNTIVRLYENKCMVRFPSDGKPFKKFYDGRWELE